MAENASMHNREDSDRLSWTLSALVVLIMAAAVGISSRESPPSHESQSAQDSQPAQDSQSAHDRDPGSPTATDRPPHAETRALPRSGTTRSLEALPTARPARL
jgi:hypothetical protein